MTAAVLAGELGIPLFLVRLDTLITKFMGEIRRELNSLLQMIEQEQSSSVIIAATNHPEILGYALFRRFDDVVEYGLPDQARITAMLKGRLAGFRPAKSIWKKAADQAVGLSYADIARAADEAIKNAIIHEQSSITEADLIHVLAERKPISARLAGRQ